MAAETKCRRLLRSGQSAVNPIGKIEIWKKKHWERLREGSDELGHHLDYLKMPLRLPACLPPPSKDVGHFSSNLGPPHRFPEFLARMEDVTNIWNWGQIWGNWPENWNGSVFIYSVNDLQLWAEKILWKIFPGRKREDLLGLFFRMQASTG